MPSCRRRILAGVQGCCEKVIAETHPRLGLRVLQFLRLPEDAADGVGSFDAHHRDRVVGLQHLILGCDGGGAVLGEGRRQCGCDLLGALVFNLAPFEHPDELAVAQQSD